MTTAIIQAMKVHVALLFSPEKKASVIPMKKRKIKHLIKYADIRDSKNFK